MVTTVTHIIPASGEWVEVANGSANVSAQLASSGRVLLHVGASEPAAGSLDGFVLSASRDAIFAATGLAGTDKVFLRAEGENYDQTVVVMAT